MNSDEIREGGHDICVSGIHVEWHPEQGTCTFENMPVAMMWLDTTLAGLMSGVQAMVGTERFALALQSEGRKSVDADWRVISRYATFPAGFRALSNIAAVAGWGKWTLTFFDEELRECRFLVKDSWEGRYQKALGVCWGSWMLAGKLAGYCSKLFGTNCWADQTAFVAGNDEWDEFIVKPSSRSIEKETERLLALDAATREDLSFALRKLQREIAERRKEEEALRESEALFRLQFEFGNIGIAITSVDRRWLRVNPRLCDMLGYTEEELLSKTWEETTHPADLRADQEQFEEMLAGKIEAYEIDKRLLPKEGGFIVVHVAVSCFRHPDGSVRFAIASLQDITGRKRTEEALAEEKERLSVTLRSIGDGVVTTDIDGRVVIMNKVAESMTGWTSKEAAGKPLEEIFVTVSELTREPCANPVKAVLETGEVVELAGQTLLIARDGREMLISDSGSPIRDKFGKIGGVVLVISDVTEKQKLLSAMQRADKLESLGVLAGGIAHDFNNLLGGIFGYLDLAKAHCEPDNPASECLNRALQVFSRAKDLTRQLLTFAKGGAPLLQTASLASLLRDTSQFALSGSNIVARYEIPEDLWLCDFDPNQLGQVVDNIVINAKQAMPSGGTLIISARNVALKGEDVPPLGKGDFVNVTFRDDGTGIPREILSRIFDPFFTTKQEGNGLGLAMVYSIIRRHSGAITVESEIGRGALFNVYLPASRQQKTAAHEGPRFAVAQSGSGRILLMDDEGFIRAMTGEILRGLGYEVATAKDGHEAKLLFMESERSATPFDAVIADLTVPGGIGGREIASELRKIRQDAIIVASSGYSDDPVMSDPHRYGFTTSLPKPYRRQELAELLTRLLGTGQDTE